VKLRKIAIGEWFNIEGDDDTVYHLVSFEKESPLANCTKHVEGKKETEALVHTASEVIPLEITDGILFY
jgi:hypothetical protein